MSIDKLERFPLPLKAEYVGKGRWQLTAPFEYHSKKYGVIKVPIFFISDGASIPKVFYTLIGGRWTGKYVEASIPHDWLYFSQIIKRSCADAIFLEGMKYLGVSFWRRRIMWLAVRLRGWIPWNYHKRRKAL